MGSRRLIIFGGGFAGVALAQRQERRAAADVEIILCKNVRSFVGRLRELN
jgi:NADH dehydrogenase FAD-containing subunit